jgi:hypothetical protein
MKRSMPVLGENTARYTRINKSITLLGNFFNEVIEEIFYFIVLHGVTLF